MKFDAHAAQSAVEVLAKRHRVKLWWHTQGGPEAHPGTRQVWIDPLVTAYDYLAALHELGHVVDADSRRLGRKGLVLGCEAAAWEWAFIHADPVVLPKVGKRTRKLVYQAWGTYVPEELD